MWIMEISASWLHVDARAHASSHQPWINNFQTNAFRLRSMHVSGNNEIYNEISSLLVACALACYPPSQAVHTDSRAHSNILMATKDKTITRVFRLNECTWDAADVDRKKNIKYYHNFSTPFDTYSQHSRWERTQLHRREQTVRGQAAGSVCHVQKKNKEE